MAKYIQVHMRGTRPGTAPTGYSMAQRCIDNVNDTNENMKAMRQDAKGPKDVYAVHENKKEVR